MAKVLFLIPPSHNHMNPSLGVAKELGKRGETVIYYSNEPLRQKVESLGALFRSYPPLNWFGVDSQVDSQTYGLEGLITQAAAFLYGNKKTSEVMMNQVSAEQPDYIVHDSYCLWAKLVAKKLGIPAISLVATAAFNMKMKNIDPEGFVNYVLRSTDQTLVKNLAVIIDNLEARFKKSYDIEDFSDIFIAKERLNIVYTSPYFQVHYETFDDTFKFVGSSVLPRGENIPFPYERLNGKPLIYIAMGGVINQHIDFYQKCMDGLRTEDIQVVLSLARIDGDSLSNIPDNFIVAKYAPQLELLQKASLFISHGGLNSVSEALYYDLPILLAPFFGDQCWVSKRVENLGAGIYLDHQQLTASQIQEAVRRILNEPSFRQNSRRIGESLRAAGGYQRAADEILKFKAEIGIR